MNTRDPKPEIMRLEQLALLVRAGDLKLPRFQRPFVWNEADMLMLLDSIYKGYPIGSILMWNSSQRLISERSISGFSINTEDNMFFPTNYLLDGQQRLTTLCGALYWPGGESDSKWNIVFDLEKETFLHPKGHDKESHFPLNKLIGTSEFIGWCARFEHHPRKADYIGKAERLLRVIKDYKIAVVTIGDMSIDEVAPIFERINSTGRKLTMVDLMMAATWSGDFDLALEIRAIASACEIAGLDGVPDTVILRSISAAAELGIAKDDIQKMRSLGPTQLKSAAVKANDALVQACAFIGDRFGIHNFGQMPYGLFLTYAAEFFRINSDADTHVLDHLAEWFWYTSITRYFASSNTSQIGRDLDWIRRYANRREARMFESRNIDISRFLFDKFNLRNATSITFAALLASIKPTRTIDGRPLAEVHTLRKSSKYYKSIVPSNDKFGPLNISKVIYPYALPRNWPIVTSTPDVLAENMLGADFSQDSIADTAENIMFERASIVRERVSVLSGCFATFEVPREVGQDRFEFDDDYYPDQDPYDERI